MIAQRLNPITIATLLCFSTPLALAAHKPVHHKNSPHEAAAISRSVPAFTNINIGGNSQLIVRIGKAQQVAIHNNADTAKCVLTDVNSDTLYIHQLSKKSCKSLPPIKLTISVPKLNTMSTQGNNSTIVTNLNNKTFLTYSSGRSHLSISGTSRSLNSIISGESSVDAHNFKTGGALITASGNSQMQLQTSGALFVRASGNAAITYSGNPTKLIKSLSGSSSLSHS